MSERTWPIGQNTLATTDSMESCVTTCWGVFSMSCCRWAVGTHHVPSHFLVMTPTTATFPAVAKDPHQEPLGTIAWWHDASIGEESPGIIDPAAAQELCLQTPSVHGDPLGPFLQGAGNGPDRGEGEPGFNQQHLGMDSYQVLGLCKTLWWTNIAIEHGHRNSGFSH